MSHRSCIWPRAIGALVLVIVLGLTAGVASRAAGRGQQTSPTGPVLVVGDSLAVGMRATFGDLMAPRAVHWDARTGRTTPQGMARLRAALRTMTPGTVVVSLGTNDGSDPHRFRSRLRRSLALMPPDACVVWAAIYRPARKGPYLALNRVLRDEARRDGRLVVVAWDREVAAGHVTLPDGLHPDAAGFALRSRLVAGAVARGCTPG